MQRILNDPDNIVDEMLQGFFKAHSDLVERTSNPRVVKAKNIPRDKVGVVTGGGSGHKPAFVGYVGENLCDAAAVGEIFSSPTPGAFLDAMKCADQGKGVVCLYGNYSGDNMNVKMAVKMAEKQGIKVRTVIANDDVASAPKEQREKGVVLQARSSCGRRLVQKRHRGQIWTRLRRLRRRLSTIPDRLVWG